MARIIQFGGVFNQQVLTGLPTSFQGVLPVRLLNLWRAELEVIEQPVGRLEIAPCGKGVRQRSGGRVSQAGGHLHQTLGAALVSQFGQRKFRLRPLGGR